MQKAITNFAESKEHGLCLIDMPTGTGKTYKTRQLIEQYLRGDTLQDIELIIYLTPLKKNIDDIYDELRDSFKDNYEIFDNNVLRLFSYYECVLDNFLLIEKDIKTPLKKKQSCIDLKTYIKTYKKLEKDNATKDILKTILNQIRTIYEPKFRRDLEAEINKEHNTEKERKKLLNSDLYSWVKILYPSCLTKDRKVLFMTVDKFLYGNDPIISKPYQFISYPKVKGALIFIDEFDSTKKVVLDQEIEKCTGRKIDLAKLFSSITSTLKNVPAPTKLFAGSIDLNDPNSSASRFLAMKQKFLSVEKEYCLNFIFKLKETEGFEQYFLFDDYQLHTISKANAGSYIGCKNDTKLNQNIIYVNENKDDGYFYRSIYSMKNALNSFIHCCSKIAKNYYSNNNQKSIETHDELIQIEQAVSTVIDYFNLDRELTQVLTGLIIDDISLPLGAKKLDIFSSDFYANGYHYYDFNDDVSHDISTAISTCYLNNTPEKFLISLSTKARVVGLSATASIDSVIGNYDLEYIRNKINDSFYELSDTEKKSIQDYVSDKLSGNYEIITTSFGLQDITADNVVNKLFSNKVIKEKSLCFLNNHFTDSDKYELHRIYKVLDAIKSFFDTPSSRVILVLTNKNIKASKEENLYSLEVVGELIKCLAIEKWKKAYDTAFSIHCLFGNDFEKEKHEYYKEVASGKKVVLFSSYPATGTGQNLQYDLEENVGELELKKKQDIDSIYIEKPTHIIIHKDNLREEADLNRYIYQMEALCKNGELSPADSIKNIKIAFKVFMNCSKRQQLSDAYSAKSVNNAIVKTLVQAIGRICRTKNKAKQVNIYIDEEIIKNVDFTVMNGRLMNREFAAITTLMPSKQNRDTETINLLNVAHDKNIRVTSRLDNLLSINRLFWNEEDAKQWKLIREIVLTYPTISREKLKQIILKTGLSSLEDFYMFNKPGFKTCYYTYNELNEQFPIIFGNNTENGGVLINAENSRLNIMMSNLTIRQEFERLGYATTFEPNDGILIPVVYQNIYKGALGEIVGKIILEKYGLKLTEINDLKKYEKFDFCLADNQDYYIDFKNWSDNDKVEKQNYYKKIERKIELVKAKKVFVLNILSDNQEIKEKNNIVVIPSLFKKINGTIKELDNSTLAEIINRFIR